MKLNIRKMNYDEAKQISTWVYKEPYSIYSMDGSEECINEFINNDYFSALDSEFELIGYYCYGNAAKVPAGNEFGVYDDESFTDIGLGIKPDLCGQGLGLDFFIRGLEFAEMNMSSEKFRLTVAAFNERAIKVYERAGFRKVSSFKRVNGDQKTEFWIMTS